MGVRRALYKKHNEIERIFRRLKGFRRIFYRFEKLDVFFLAFLNFAGPAEWKARLAGDLAGVPILQRPSIDRLKALNRWHGRHSVDITCDIRSTLVVAGRKNQ